MQVIRYADGYLFTARAPDDRAFEERQRQVRDWCNYAVQQAATLLFQNASEEQLERRNGDAYVISLSGWRLHIDVEIRLPEHTDSIQELVLASSLLFQGLRSTYKREGFGSEFVAVTPFRSLTEEIAESTDSEGSLR